jgi:hypothetical protein
MNFRPLHHDRVTLAMDAGREGSAGKGIIFVVEAETVTFFAKVAQIKKRPSIYGERLRTGATTAGSGTK